MQALGNLDCFFLAKEMQGSLAGGFIENFYDYGNGVFRMRFSKKSVLVDLRGFAFIASDAAFPEPPTQPSSFAMLLRKHLASAKLERVVQPNFERILEFEFSSKKLGRVFLVAELFGRAGNLLLLDSNREIVAPFRKVSYAARSLEHGRPYVLPPSEKKAPPGLSLEDLNGGVGEGGRIVSFLSKKTSLAPFYLEEACVRAGIPLDASLASLGEQEKKRLLECIRALFNGFSPSIFLEGSKPTAFSSVKLEKLGESAVVKPMPSLSEAIADYYSSLSFEALDPRAGNLLAQLHSQEALLEGFAEKESAMQAAGKWVFQNTELVDGLLQTARKNQDPAALASAGKKLGLKAIRNKESVELAASE